MALQTPVPIALIGSGIFAKEEHLPAILAVPQLLTLKAIYSRSAKSAKSLAEGLPGDVSGVELYSEDQDGRGYDELLKRGDIQGVIIALPILNQPDYIQRALSASKHVLAEKPIAKDISTAQSLIKFHSSLSQSPAPTLSIAENFRYLESFVYASQQVSTLGRILGFRTRVSSLVAPGAKYYETEWRKTPGYQGGFLLDGGVHFIAGTRVLLGGDGEEGEGKGSGVKMTKCSAFTAQLQEHLPPVDTLNSVIQLSNGSSGTLSISFGTTDKGPEYLVACEAGTVHVSRGKVTVNGGGEEQVKEFPDEGSGVKLEVRAWAEGLQRGKMDPFQGAEEALRDLEVLESCLKSGEAGGAPVELKLQ